MVRRRATTPSIVTMLLAALIGSIAVGMAGPAGAGTQRGSALFSVNWEVGDCYTQADVDNDLVDLTSQVSCDEPHAVQSIGGAKLPKSLAAWTRSELLTTNRSALQKFADKTCGPTETVKTLYPDQAKALSKQFATHEVSDFLPPAFGRDGWALSDPESWDAGAKALLCVFEFQPLPWSAPIGDLRDISTSDPLVDLRLCQDFNESSVDFVQCDGAHDAESLIWVGLPLKGQPADVNAWKDADWAPFDKACADLARVIIGGSPAGIVYRADTSSEVAPEDGHRFFNCRTYPKDETKAFAAGQIMAGAGNAKVQTTGT